MKLFRLLPADRRHSMHLAGIGLSGVGLALILSVLVTLTAHLADLSQLQGRGLSITFRALAGLIVAGAGFAAMTVAVHTAPGANHHHEVDVHDVDDAAPRRSDRDRDLLLRVGEDDVNLLDDSRRWPKLALPRRLPFSKLSESAAPVTSVPTVALAAEERADSAVVVVKIRCRECRRLSSEEASYCEHCGGRL